MLRRVLHPRLRLPVRLILTAAIATLVQFALAATTHASAQLQSGKPLRARDLEPVANIVQAEIAAGRIPGAVVLIGNRGRILFDRAFGYRTLEPRAVSMTVDTIFDLASLTKVIATTTAVMQLVERGQLALDEPVATYWPEFASHGKAAITIRELLTHYSGLRADLDLHRHWSGYGAALSRIASQRPVYPPGTHYIYSDVNFEALGEVVRRVSGLPLDRWCERYIFAPLGMKDTDFRVPAAKRARIAPTEFVRGKTLSGGVNDPTAQRMAGVAGHAGLFSTAHDLAMFAEMMLGGRGAGIQILRRSTIEEMTAPASPPGAARLRGLGWDLGAPLAVNRSQFPPVGSYGHTGYTGTMIWIDPMSETYVIILTNRVYASGGGDAGPVRAEILDLVAQKLGPSSIQEIAASNPALHRYLEQTGALRQLAPERPTVETGADVLVAENFAPLRGLRVGLITNRSGVDSKGDRDADLMHLAPGLRLVNLFSPEHGLTADLDGKVASGIDASSGLPVLSLYGEVTRPSDAMLAGLDALIFDVQDAGARFYTYATTMAFAMEAAAERGIAFYVLDRPDPLSAAVVQGPVTDDDLRSFTGYFPMPVRHGMTIGELARLFNTEAKIGARLRVIRMRGYQRSEWYDDTRLVWVPPSPNLRTLAEVTLYPGVALVEGTNVSVGRGTATPFEQIGAPWIDGPGLAAYLNRRSIPGVAFAPADFVPESEPYKGRPCHGVRIALLNRGALDSPELGIEIASALERLYPGRFALDQALPMIGSRDAVEALHRDEDPRTIARGWRGGLARFRKLRAKYLLY